MLIFHFDLSCAIAIRYFACNHKTSVRFCFSFENLCKIVDCRFRRSEYIYHTQASSQADEMVEENEQLKNVRRDRWVKDITRSPIQEFRGKPKHFRACKVEEKRTRN
jgi:hypothetical protein